MDRRILGLTVYTAISALILLAFSSGQLNQFQYASKRFNLLLDRHNLGYLLREKRQVKLAVSTGKILFYYALPPRKLDLSKVQVNCSSVEGVQDLRFNQTRRDANILWRRVCPDLTNILSAFHLIKLDALNYYESIMGQIYSMIADSEVENRVRSKRGVWTDGWSYFTGLPSPEDLAKLQRQLDAITPAIKTASETWAAGTSQFISAIKIQKERVDKLYELINISRADVRAFNSEILSILGEEDLRTSLIGQVITTLKKTIFQISQLEALYYGVEDLVRRQLSHYIVSHEQLNHSLYNLQDHLDVYEPNLKVAELDVWFYYAQGEFKVFRYKNYLVINLRVPLTTKDLLHTFSVFKLIPIFLAGPEVGDKHYTTLKTHITSIVYNPLSTQYNIT